VFSTFCESHGLDVSFHVVARMLRAAFRLNQLDAASARALLQARFPAAEPDDVALLHDLVGIQNNGVALPDIEPDARRRRLAQMINAALLARQAPVLYVIEDAHWIDRASEALFAEFFSVIPWIPAMVLVTYRPEYRGVLTQTPGSQTISLAPLSDSQTAVLAGEMLGAHPSVKRLVRQVAERAVGNPFFAEEIVRDLVGRGVLHGNRSSYVSSGDVTEVSVPATVQATIAARIDRLGGRAKQTLNAAAVIGLRFDEVTLVSLIQDAALEELIAAELVDPVVFAPHTQYAFRHPLIRAVAYESQLKSGRAELHRCLARAIEQRDPGSVDENAALIATHLEAAGNLREAFSWHMRAGSWSRYRDIGAARVSWQHARQVADRLSSDVTPLKVDFVAGSGTATPDGPFIAVGDHPPAGATPRVRFDRGRVAVADRSGHTLLDLAGFVGGAVAQVVNAGDHPGVWIKPLSADGGVPAPSDLHLDHGDVAFIDGNGVALAMSTERDTVVKISYPDQVSWLTVAERFRSWIIGGLWLFATVALLFVLQRLFRRRPAHGAE